MCMLHSSLMATTAPAKHSGSNFQDTLLRPVLKGHQKETHSGGFPQRHPRTGRSEVQGLNRALASLLVVTPKRKRPAGCWVRIGGYLETTWTLKKWGHDPMFQRVMDPFVKGHGDSIAFSLTEHWRLHCGQHLVNHLTRKLFANCSQTFKRDQAAVDSTASACSDPGSGSSPSVSHVLHRLP